MKAPGKAHLDPAWVTCPSLNNCEQNHEIADFPSVDSCCSSNQTIWDMSPRGNMVTFKRGRKGVTCKAKIAHICYVLRSWPKLETEFFWADLKNLDIQVIHVH